MTTSPNWVWIRGFARESAHWGTFTEQFASKFPERKIVHLDIPGSGENREMEVSLSIPDMIPDLRKQLQNKIGNQKFNFFCLSLGAMFAMEWMNQFPQDVETAVLVNPSSKKHSAFYERLRFQAYTPIARALAASSLRKRELAILEIISNKPEIYKEVAAQWTKIAKQRPMTYAAVAKQLAAGARYSPPENFSDKIKVLVLVSLGDRMVEPRCGLSLAEAYGWQVKSHPWAGHDLSLDDPDWVINALSQWSSSES